MQVRRTLSSMFRVSTKPSTSIISESVTKESIESFIKNIKPEVERRIQPQKPLKPIGYPASKYENEIGFLIENYDKDLEILATLSIENLNTLGDIFKFFSTEGPPHFLWDANDIVKRSCSGEDGMLVIHKQSEEYKSRCSYISNHCYDLAKKKLTITL